MAMSLRPRRGGAQRQPLRPTYDTFKPRSEWNDTGKYMFLYIYLSGFRKEQIKVTWDESTQIIRIRGQRPLSTYRWTQFDEPFRVPEKCDMSKIQTSFLSGLLTIELPIIDTSAKPDPKTPLTDVSNEERDEATSSRAKSDDQKQTTTDDRSFQDSSLQEKGQDDEPGKAAMSKDIGKERGDENIGLGSEESREKELGKVALSDGTEKGANENENKNFEIRSEKGLEEKPGKGSSSRTEIQKEKDGDENIKQISQKGQEETPGEAVLGDGEKKEAAREGLVFRELTAEKTTDLENDSGKASSREKYTPEAVKKDVAVMHQLQDDRKSLVNVGAATLVIMGLGASLFGPFVRFIG